MVVFLIYGGIVLLPVILQYFLSKREGKWFSLNTVLQWIVTIVLPVIAIIVLYFVTMDDWVSPFDKDIYEYSIDIILYNSIPFLALGAVPLFVISVHLLAVALVRRKRS